MATYDKESIVRYVEGELSGEALSRFEADLRADPQLARDVAFYRELRETLSRRLPRDEGEEALTGRMRALRPEYFGGTPEAAGREATAHDHPGPDRGRVVPLIRYVAAAAAVAAVAALALFWPSSRGNLTDLGNTRMIGSAERGSGGDSLLDSASVFFNAGQFARALPYLDSAVRSDTASRLAQFYRGVAEWHTGDLPAGRKDLIDVFNSGSALQYDAAFYMALTYATQGNKSQALHWLQKIPAGTPASGKANALKKILGGG